MYRIELSPGEETAFRSIEELAVAIRRKVVTSHARIYHNATSRWLPIQFHPHYKIALTMPLTPADLVAGPPVAPLSALKLGEAQNSTPALATPSNRQAATQAALAAWPEPKPAASQPAKSLKPEPYKVGAPPEPPRRASAPGPEPLRFIEPMDVLDSKQVVAPRPGAEPPIAMTPAPIVPPRRKARRAQQAAPLWIAEPAPARTSSQRRKRKRSFRVALAGALLLACAQVVMSAASTSTSGFSAALPTPRKLIMTPVEAMEEDSPRTVATVMPGLQSIPVPGLTTSRSNATPSAPSNATSSARRTVVSAPANPAAPSVSDSAADLPEPLIEAAPDVVPATEVRADPVIPQVADSSGKKAMTGLLRSISGSPAVNTKASKR